MIARGGSPAKARKAAPRSPSPNRKVVAASPGASEATGAATKTSFGFTPLFASSDLAVGNEIGKGRFKKVFRGTLRRNGEQDDRDVVILRYPRSGDQKREVQNLAALACQGLRAAPYVPEIIGICDERRQLVVLQERAVLGSMKGALTEGELATKWTHTHKLFASAQVAQAMVFLESMRMVHADLSCRNLLLHAFSAESPCSIRVKVSDFGLAVILRDGEDHECREQPKATRWCAPEHVAYQKLSHRSDVWSYGATIWEMFAGGEVPWSAWPKRVALQDRLVALAEAVSAGQLAPDEHERIKEEFKPAEDCPPKAHGMILACLSPEATERPTFARLGDVFAGLAEPQAAPEIADDTPLSGSANEQEQEGAFADKEATPAGGSGSSTAASWSATPPPPAPPPCKWAQRLGYGAQRSESTERFASRCGALREFLCSTEALQLLGEEAAVEAFKAFLQSREARMLRGEWADGDMFSSPASTQHELLAGLPNGPDVRMMPPLDEAQAEPRKGSSTATSTALSSPRLYAWPGAQPVGTESSTDTWADNVWTVQTLVGPSLFQKKEFPGEAAARAAYHVSAASGAPCMLRDPDGVEVAAQSWLVMDHTSPTPKARNQSHTRRCTTPVPAMASLWGLSPERSPGASPPRPEHRVASPCYPMARGSPVRRGP